MSSSPRAGCLPRIGGALALDFCNTTTGRGTDHFVEHLFDHADVLRWAAFNELLTPAAAQTLSGRQPAAAAAFARSMALRALLNRIFDAMAQRRPVEPADLAELSDLAVADWRQARLGRAGSGFAWHFPPPDADAGALLGPIIRSATALLTGAEPARLKGCPGQHCGWVFLDASKNASRVWCEMEVCGTRAKLGRRASRRRQAVRP